MPDSPVIDPITILLKNSAKDDAPFLRLNFQDEIMSIELSVEGRGVATCNAPFDDHCIFELETLSEGLRYVVEGNVPEYLEVPSKEGWMGSVVWLRPALLFELGLAVGKPASTVQLYASRRIRIVRDSMIELEATLDGFSSAAKFTPDEVLAFADELYAAAKALTFYCFSAEELNSLGY